MEIAMHKSFVKAEKEYLERSKKRRR